VTLNCGEENNCVVLADADFVCDKAAIMTLVLGDTTVETSTVINFVSFWVRHDGLSCNCMKFRTTTVFSYLGSSGASELCINRIL
jgi:hypothetical protein